MSWALICGAVRAVATGIARLLRRIRQDLDPSLSQSARGVEEEEAQPGPSNAAGSGANVTRDLARTTAALRRSQCQVAALQADHNRVTQENNVLRQGLEDPRQQNSVLQQNLRQLLQWCRTNSLLLIIGGLVCFYFNSFFTGFSTGMIFTFGVLIMDQELLAELISAADEYNDGL